MKRIWTLLAAVVGVTLVASGLVAHGGTAHGDALCDAMRARFGPGYPCIAVPTNTFTPTAPAGPTTTPGTAGQSNSGPQVGSNVGPGPGKGNGTPIVPVPGQQTPTARQVPQATPPQPTTAADNPATPQQTNAAAPNVITVQAPGQFDAFKHNAGFCVLGHNKNGSCRGSGVVKQCGHAGRGTAIGGGITGSFVGPEAIPLGVAGGFLGGCIGGISNGLP